MSRDMSGFEGLVSSLYSIIRSQASPVHLFTVKAGKGSVQISKEKLLRESEDHYEVNLDDVLLAAYICEVPILLVGGTGRGKTHVTGILFDTLFGLEASVMIRCSGGAYQVNPAQKLLKSRLEGGVPRIEPNKEVCGRLQGFFCDEINRAETNPLLQIIDGEIKAGGDKAELGIELKDRIKGPLIVGAMNPPTPGYKEATQLDQAVRNRFLEVQVPSITPSAGISSAFYERRRGLNERLVERLGVRKEDWLSHLASMAIDVDSRINFLYAAIELQEHLINAFLGDYKERFGKERELAQSLKKELGADFYFPPYLEESETLRRMEDIVKSFEEEPCTPRDVTYSAHLSRMIALIRHMKGILRGEKELETIYVTPSDVGAAATVYWNGKGGKDVAPLVQTVFNDYNRMLGTYSLVCGKPASHFRREGIKKTLIMDSLRSRDLDRILSLTSKLKEYERPASFSTFMKARDLNTLGVFLCFCRSFPKEVEEALQSESEIDAYNKLGKIFLKHEYKLPSVYSHRLRSVFV